MIETNSFQSSYVRRTVDDELDEILAQLPAVLLDGAKGVGKTSTAVQRSRTVRRLDVDSERAVAEADPFVIASDDPPVLIDEWHRVPAVWDAVRRLVDDGSPGGRFLLTGSPPGVGIGASTHSGAGRIASVRMRPLSFAERHPGCATVSFAGLLEGREARRSSISGRSAVTLVDYVDEIVSSGFPGMRHFTGRALATQLDGYVDRIVEHDLPEAGFTVRRPATVRRWLTAYAAAVSTTASFEKIRDAARGSSASAPAKATTMAYTELLTALRIVDPIEAWLPTRNHFARLSSAPKHQLVDPALAVRLLDRTRHHLLAGEEGPVAVPRNGTLLGALFESLAGLSVRSAAQAAAARTSHLRTDGGRHEVDFIVERDGGVLALEVKLASTVTSADVRHLLWLREKLGDDLVDAVVITTGPEAYRRSDGIAVVPLALLGP